MSDPYTGGCACGTIRYHVVGEPVVMNYCQCRDCQRDSGAGHGAHVTFIDASVSISGEPGQGLTVGEGGMRKTRAFCRDCGNPVYLTSPDVPQLFVASAASLDDPGRFQPQQVIWTASGHSWDRLDPGLPRFEKMPPAA